jgi:hypothetical protein
MPIVSLVKRTPFPKPVPAVGRHISAMAPVNADIAHVPAIFLTGSGRGGSMTGEQFDRNKRYLAAIAVVHNMLDRGLIDELEYSALETKFAAKYLPLIRYDKPCLFAAIPVTQTVEGRAANEPNHQRDTSEAAKSAKF